MWRKSLSLIHILSMCIICYKDVKVKGFEMVKNSNNDDLAKKKVDPKYYLLYQLWKELTAKKTLDKMCIRDRILS